MTQQVVTRHIRAPRAAIYRALLDPEAVARWRVPDGMRATVHAFEPHEGGRFRISLQYDDPSSPGKTDGHTDTYHGRFARLVPDAQVTEVLAFETDDPALQGEMTVTTSLRDAGEATEVTIDFSGLPRGVSAADNRLGTEMALGKLAQLLQTAR